MITIGGATFDVLLRSKDFSIMEAGRYLTGRAECLPLGSKIEVRDITFSTGGGATNAAVSFSRKGIKTGALVRVGHDPHGKEILADLAKEGVSTRFVQESHGGHSGYSIVLVTLSGERSLIVHRGVSANISHHEIDWAQMKARWYYVSSLAGDIDLMKSVCEHAHNEKAKVAWNPGGRELHLGINKLVYLLKHVEILILNQEEAALLTGLPFEETTRIFLKLKELVPGVILMTKGPDGALVSDGKHLYNAGIFEERERVDRTGAGDAFGSGFVAGIILDGSIKEALRIASANATSNIESVGAKSGLLTLRQLSEKRWQKLPVEKRLL